METAARLGKSLRRIPRRLLQRYGQPFVFIHINKTGGSSIERALGIRLEHRTALEKQRELGDRHFARKLCFSFIRNPWDRVVSHFRYRVHTNQTGLGDAPIPFVEWVRRAYGEKDPRYYDKPRLFMPQLDWLSDLDGTLLVDFVGRFERLHADFAVVCEKLAVRATLPHLKNSGTGDFRPYYDDRTAEIVARHFSRDIARFGYRFDTAEGCSG